MPIGFLVFLIVIFSFISIIPTIEKQFKIATVLLSIALFHVIWGVVACCDATYTSKEFKVINVNGAQWCMDDPPFNLNRTFGKTFDGDTIVLKKRNSKFGIYFDGYVLGE